MCIIKMAYPEPFPYLETCQQKLCLAIAFVERDASGCVAYANPPICLIKVGWPFRFMAQPR